MMTIYPAKSSGAPALRATVEGHRLGRSSSSPLPSLSVENRAIVIWNCALNKEKLDNAMLPDPGHSTYKSNGKKKMPKKFVP